MRRRADGLTRRERQPRRRHRRTRPRSRSSRRRPTDPFGLIAWLFTPLFQAFFIVLVVLDKVTGNIAIAIVLMTLLLRIVLIPIFRRQTVSTKRTQLLAPEVKEIQKRYKGDRLKAQEAQKQLYAERGINPLAGCLPALLQIFLLIPMYSVFSQGLQNYNPQAMLDVFGFRSDRPGLRPGADLQRSSAT